MYTPEAKLHRLINSVKPVKDKLLASLIADEIYLSAYGLLEDHPWAVCLVSKAESNPYYYMLKKYISMYKKMHISSLGISLKQFLDLPSQTIIALLEAASEE